MVPLFPTQFQSLLPTQYKLSTTLNKYYLPALQLPPLQGLSSETLQTICKDTKLAQNIQLIFLTHLTFLFILFNKQWRLWLAELPWASPVHRTSCQSSPKSATATQWKENITFIWQIWHLSEHLLSLSPHSTLVNIYLNNLTWG